MSAKDEKIRDLFFKQGKSITKIKPILFPECYNERGNLKSRSKENKEANEGILKALGFDNYGDYDKALRQINVKLRLKSGWPGIRKKVLERDDNKCVVTGKTDNLHIHHKDGNKENNSMDNLITVHRSIHNALHSNMDFKSHQYKHFQTYQKYIKYLRKNGYPTAGLVITFCKSCKTAHSNCVMENGELPLDIWKRRIKYDYNKWIVLPAEFFKEAICECGEHIEKIVLLNKKGELMDDVEKAVNVLVFRFHKNQLLSAEFGDLIKNKPSPQK